MKLSLIPFKQEGIQMYAGVIKVDDLIKVGKVDVYRNENGEQKGYQRVPEHARTAKIAKWLKASKKPLMPTSILLSYRGILPRIKEENGTVIVDINEQDVLWLVDGQHRTYGFQKAIEDENMTRFKEYPLPMVLAEFTDFTEEAEQFRIINETMKKVRTDLARRILELKAGFSRDSAREVRSLGRSWEIKAVNVIKALNSDEGSPWFNRIQPPNEKRSGSSYIVRELSFSTSLKQILKQYPYDTWTVDRVAKALKEYWIAWRSLAPEAFEKPEDFVIMKTPGIFSLHQLARYILGVLRRRDILEPNATDFRTILSDLGEYATSDYWRADNKEGAALAGSMKSFSLLADMLQEELADNGHVGD